MRVVDRSHFSNPREHQVANPFTAYRDDVPAPLSAEAAPLFAWARERAEDIAKRAERIASERDRLALVTSTVEESMEFGAVEEAREAVKAAKDAALDNDATYVKAKDALSKARKALREVKAAKSAKALKSTIRAMTTGVATAKDELTAALAAGKVPGVVEDVAARTERQMGATS